MKGLTVRQQETLDFIEDFSHREGMAPTMYEIADFFHIKTATVFAHVRALQKKGYITRSSKARSMALTQSSNKSNVSLALSIPMLGYISAGAPLLSEEHVSRHISLDPSAFPNLKADKPLFALSVSGESMRDLGIMDGDTLIAEQIDRANVGDVIVAMIDGGETTVKSFYIKDGQVELRPANDEYPSRFFNPAEVHIQGKVSGLIRTF